MKILIVDDRPLNLKLLLAVLEAEGHSIRQARDGVEALAVLNAEPVDAIISDILMPRMDGYLLCYEVRQSERLRGIPFIFYTATYTSPADEKLCLSMGADKYLKKPAAPAVLVAALNDVKRSKRPHSPAPISEMGVMKEYSEQLVAKLEEKNFALEESNAALSRARGQMSHLLAHSPAVIYALKVKGQQFVPYLVSENITRLLGFTVEEASSYEWWAGQLHPEESARAQASVPETLEKGALTTEYRIRHKDGRYIWVEDSRRVVFDAEGQRIEIAGVWSDITERKQTEAALHESERQYRNTQARLNSTLAAGSIGTWTWDIVNDRLVADEFTARMFSLDVDAAAKGLPVEAFLTVLHEEDRPGVADALESAIRSCGQYDIEYRVRQKNGEFRWLQARGRVEGDAKGKALYFHGAVIAAVLRTGGQADLQPLQCRHVREETRSSSRAKARQGLVLALREEVFVSGQESIMLRPNCMQRR